MPAVILIGLGPAGASAAIYLCRANRRALLVGKDFGAPQKAEKIENYFGLEAVSYTHLDVYKRQVP